MKRTGEIKFRAYTQEKMWDVIEWNFDSQAVGRQDLLLRDDAGNEFRELLKNLDLMQYTGLHDKHGKEIYGGDVVKSQGYKNLMQVIWQEDGGYFRAKRFHSDTGAAFNVYPSSEFEVIGNMYENPELLNT